MFATYAGCVPAEADLVCYWFENAGRQIASSKGPGCRLYARKAAALAAGNDALEAKRVQMDRGAKPNACCIREAVRERWWLRRWSSGPLVKLCRSGILRTCQCQPRRRAPLVGPRAWYSPRVFTVAGSEASSVPIPARA